MQKTGKFLAKQNIFQSAIARVVVAVIALVLPVNLFTLLLSNMVLQENRERTAQNEQGRIEIEGKNLEGILNSAFRRLLYLSLSDSDFITMANSGRELNNSEKGSLLYEIKEGMKSAQQEYSRVDLIYFHFPRQDYVLLQGSPGANVGVIREWVREDSAMGMQIGASWETVTVDDVSMLWGSGSWNNASFGLFLNLEWALRDLNMLNVEGEGCVFFLDSEGNVVTTQGQDYLEKQGRTLEEIRGSRKYGVFTYKMENCGLELVEVVEWNAFASNLPGAIVAVQVISIVLMLLVIPLLLLYIHRQVRKPLNRLTHAMDEIEQGNLDYRIETSREGREFEQMNRNFNAMMEQIKDLKIETYEKELERRDIKMRYLSQQIQPHFILNAMNIIYSYEPEEYPQIQRMVQCISKYFRYVVKMNARFVWLSQEMDHIKNYFEIQKARFPELFFAVVEYEEGLGNAWIPPLLVQNFAENAIKYSLKIGKKVSIFVIADYYPGESEEPMMRIRLADTGEGMCDEILEKIRVFQETGEVQEGLGVGIQNSIERLKYLYGGSGSIRFWRDENYSGTNVEILLPIHLEETFPEEEI